MTDQSGPSTSITAPQWLEDFSRAALALQEWMRAQWQLFGAELQLARSAVTFLLGALLLVLVLGVALGVTLLALVGLGLCQWLGSWTGALLVLAGLLALLLVTAVWVCRRCLHRLSLPDTRSQWRAFMHQRTNGQTPIAPEKAEETSTHESASQTG